MVITSLPRDSHSKGDREPEDWPGGLIFRSRVSAVWCLVRAFRFGWQVQEICPPSSVIDSVLVPSCPRALLSSI